MCCIVQVHRGVTARVASRQPNFSVCVLSAWGRHHHPAGLQKLHRAKATCTSSQLRQQNQRHPAPSLQVACPSTHWNQMGCLHGLWTEPRIRDLIKIGSQDYYRIKTSLIQISLALCQSCAHGFCPQEKPDEAATQTCSTGCLVRGKHARRAGSVGQHSHARKFHQPGFGHIPMCLLQHFHWIPSNVF